MKLNKPLVKGFVALTIVNLMSVSNANAVIVVDSGVDVITQRYTIDTANSQILYNTREIVFDIEDSSGQTQQTFELAGSFDVQFQRHWWRYYQSGDVTGSQGTFEFISNWLEFSNPLLEAEDLPADFVFPTFNIRTNNVSFEGNNGPCSMPFGPNTYCTGFSTGSLSVLSGTLEDGLLILDGSQPMNSGVYTYHLEATSVPLPGAWLLFVSMLGVLGWMRKQRQLPS